MTIVTNDSADARTRPGQPELPGVPGFDEIFRTYGRFVWRVLARLGVPAADVADICQEVFLVVHRRLGDYDGRASLHSWIYGITVRTASSHRRKVRARRESEAPVPERPVQASQEHELDRDRARRCLRGALDRLDEDKRAVFVLYELEELTMSEIAEALDCPLQTAYSRLHAARKLVAGTFRRTFDPGGGAP